MSKTILKVENISHKYREDYALKNVNFDIKKGEIIALVGHNGSGKSTLLNIISGILEPTEGNVEFERGLIDELGFSNIGFSPQTQIIDWYTTVWDNIYLGMSLAKVSKTKRLTYINEVLKLLGLEELKNATVDSLSGGQQQRVQIGRALIHKPNFYLLDEPTTGLDIEYSNNLLEYLKREVEKGKSAIISSHDLNLLEEYCEKMILLDEGEIIYVGEIKSFMKNEVKEIKYVLSVSEEVTYNLEEIAYKIPQQIILEQLENNKIEVKLSENIELSKLITILSRHFNILSFEEMKPTLKELYLNYRREKEF